MTRPLVPCLALASALWLGACAGDSACPASGQSLTILSPMDGEAVTGSEFDVTLRVCGFERDDVIALVIDEPVASDYGFVTYLGDPVLTLRVPALPGTMRMHATDDATRTVRSSDVSVTTAP